MTTRPSDNEKLAIELAMELTLSTKPPRELLNRISNRSPFAAMFIIARMAELLLDPKAPGLEQRRAAWERLCGVLKFKAG